MPGTAPAAPLDREVLALAGDALARGEQVTVERAVHNTDRAIGTLLSGEIVRRLGPDALADGALTLRLAGTAGQSLGAWGIRGLVLDLEGQANDYVGKGLSGARIVVRPPAGAGYEPTSSIAVGNTTLYGATSGELFVRGRAGERFAVRNSGATAVVEGVGRHGCEYMTGGLVAVLGPVGRNFAAGMSGGIAYLWDPDGENARRVNSDMVLLRAVSDDGRAARADRAPPRADRQRRGRRAARRLGYVRGTVRRGHAARPAAHRGRARPRARGRPWLTRADSSRCSGASARCGRRSSAWATTATCTCTRPRTRCATRRAAACRAACRSATSGCPLGNLIPDWNDLVHRGRWQEASERLHSTNSFPELTGKLCPAPCEEACVLTINDDAVTIKEIEWAIVERAWEEGWITPQPAEGRTGRSVGVVGSGPAGLAAAQQLARAGHAVTVYERDDRAGGLLRYGIPDFKLEKNLIDRRVAQLVAEGVEFALGVDVGDDVPVDELRARHDALVLATGAQRHRRLTLPGAELAGVHLAMEYLVQQNRRVAGLPVTAPELSANGLRVAILGGGDTSADCLGNVLREGCASVVEIAHGPTPPQRAQSAADVARVAVPPAHLPGARGGRRARVAARDGRDRGRRGRVQRPARAARRVPGLRRDRRAAAGPGARTARSRSTSTSCSSRSASPASRATTRSTASSAWSSERAPRVPVDGTFATPLPGVFAAGDCVRGADLIVQAIADGREAARSVDLALQGASALPSRVAV